MNYLYNHDFNSYYDVFGTALSIVFFIILFIIFLTLIFAIVSYVLQGIALYTMAQKRNFRYPWLAWIPLANKYIFGALINDRVSLGALSIPYAAIILPLVAGVSSLLSVLILHISFIGTFLIFLMLLLAAVYQFAAFYRFYQIYYADNAVLYLVLSIIFPVTTAFFLFSLRHKEANDLHFQAFKPYPKNPRAILSLCFGALSLLSSFLNSGFMLGCCAILLGILAFNEGDKGTNDVALFAILGIILGVFGILLKLILPIIDFTLFPDGSTLTHLVNNLYSNKSNYPFL